VQAVEQVEVIDAGETAELTLSSHGLALGPHAFNISAISGETTRSRLLSCMLSKKYMK